MNRSACWDPAIPHGCGALHFVTIFEPATLESPSAPARSAPALRRGRALDLPIQRREELAVLAVLKRAARSDATARRSQARGRRVAARTRRTAA